LLALMHFVSFTAIADAEVQDVREVLVYYKNFENPLAQFRENQRKVLEQEEEMKRLEQTKTSPVVGVRKWTPSFLGGR
jgi:mitochondrial import inner membrane translocase subunit TIM50